MKATGIILAMAAISGTAIAAEVATGPFGMLDLSKVCVSGGDGDQFVLDRARLACHLIDKERTGGPSMCEFEPAREKLIEWLAEHRGHEFELMTIPGASEPFRLVTPPACQNVGPLDGSEVIRSDCIRIVCDGYTPPETADSSGSATARDISNWRIRQKPTDLALPRSKAGSATFSLNRNFDNGGNTFAAEATIGYGFAGELREDVNGLAWHPYTLTPYIGVNRIERTGPGKPDVTNLFAGFDATVTISDDAVFKGVHEFVADGRVITDEEADSLIVDGSLIYRPIPAEYLFTTGADIGPFWLLIQPSAHLDFGIVFDPGTKPQLQTTSDYLRAGGGLHVELFPDPGAFGIDAIEDFSLALDYKYSHGFSGPLDDAQYFEAALNYKIPNADNFGFSLRYVNGDVAATLEEVEFMEASFTVKF